MENDFLQFLNSAASNDTEVQSQIYKYYEESVENHPFYFINLLLNYIYESDNKQIKFALICIFNTFKSMDDCMVNEFNQDKHIEIQNRIFGLFEICKDDLDLLELAVKVVCDAFKYYNKMKLWNDLPDKLIELFSSSKIYLADASIKCMNQSFLIINEPMKYLHFFYEFFNKVIGNFNDEYNNIIESTISFLNCICFKIKSLNNNDFLDNFIVFYNFLPMIIMRLQVNDEITMKIQNNLGCYSFLNYFINSLEDFLDAFLSIASNDKLSNSSRSSALYNIVSIAKTCKTYFIKNESKLSNIFNLCISLMNKLEAVTDIILALSKIFGENSAFCGSILDLIEKIYNENHKMAFILLENTFPGIFRIVGCICDESLIQKYCSPNLYNDDPEIRFAAFHCLKLILKDIEFSIQVSVIDIIKIILKLAPHEQYNEILIEEFIVLKHICKSHIFENNNILISFELFEDILCFLLNSIKCFPTFIIIKIVSIFQWLVLQYPDNMKYTNHFGQFVEYYFSFIKEKNNDDLYLKCITSLYTFERIILFDSYVKLAFLIMNDLCQSEIELIPQKAIIKLSVLIVGLKKKVFISYLSPFIQPLFNIFSRFTFHLDIKKNSFIEYINDDLQDSIYFFIPDTQEYLSYSKSEIKLLVQSTRTIAFLCYLSDELIKNNYEQIIEIVIYQLNILVSTDHLHTLFEFIQVILPNINDINILIFIFYKIIRIININNKNMKQGINVCKLIIDKLGDFQNINEEFPKNVFHYIVFTKSTIYQTYLNQKQINSECNDVLEDFKYYIDLDITLSLFLFSLVKNFQESTTELFINEYYPISNHLEDNFYTGLCLLYANIIESIPNIGDLIINDIINLILSDFSNDVINIEALGIISNSQSFIKNYGVKFVKEKISPYFLKNGNSSIKNSAIIISLLEIYNVFGDDFDINLIFEFCRVQYFGINWYNIVNASKGLTSFWLKCNITSLSNDKRNFLINITNSVISENIPENIELRKIFKELNNV